MIVQGAVHDANQTSMLPYTMSKATKLPLNSLNDFLTCKLCRGYYIDASTIIECLHSFCRSCIVKYLEKNKYCPICDVQVHKTKPLINIRQDKILQSIVYKLVPRLFQNEMLRRKCFYASHPEEKKDLDVEELGEASYQHILAPDENICVALNYKDSPLTPRYLQCSAALSIFHLQKLIRSKYDLSSNHRIDIFHGDDVLNCCLTLIDVAYSSLWRRKGPLELTYRIFESTLSPTANINLNSPSDDNINTNNNNNNNASNDWKEVQIQISENGEMSVTGIQDCLQLLDNMDDLEEPVKTTSNKKDSVNTEDRLDLIPLQNSSKITKVELNQPPSQNSQLNTADVVMLDTPLLPALTLTVAELKELSKIEEAAKTQASDTLPSPPPAKKLKKELPELKSIVSNKMQKKNGAKSTSPHATEKNVTESTISIAKQTINSSIPVNSSKNVIVTSTITIPPCSTQEQVAAIASTTNSTAIVTATSTVAMSTSTSTVAMSTSTSTVATKTSGSAIAMTTSTSTSAMTTLASTVAMTTSTSTTALTTVAMTTPTAVMTSTSSTTGAVKLSTADTSVAATSSFPSNSSKVPNNSISNINNVKTACTTSSVSTSTTVLTTSNTSIITGAGKLANSSITSVTISKPIITASAVALSSSSVNTTLKTSTSASKRKHPSSTATPTLSDHKLPKPTILNHSLGLQKSLNLSKNHPLTTKHQKAVETAAKVANNPVSLLNSQNQANNSKWNAGVPLKSYGTLINVPKVPAAAQTSQVNKQQAAPACTSTTTVTHPPPTAITTVTASILDGKQQLTSGGQQTNTDSSVLMIKSKASTPIGYKTLKDPPKTWNPTLHHKVGPQLGGTAAKPGDLKNVRPAKFFKMRNNMPRYLGCPNSGVKPMFQVHVSPEKEKSNVPETASTPTQLTSHTTPSITTTTTTTTSVACAQSLHLTTPVIVTLPSPSPAPQSIKPVEQQIRKHSIVKIDPKTLKPISEKAPESSNLSTKSTVSALSTSKSLVAGRGDQPQKGGGLNSCQGKKQEESAVGSNKGSYELRDLEKGKSASPHQSDQSTSRTHQLTTPTTTASATSTSNLNLRINTTSVSITNPLKKSPHSPKKSTSPPNQQNHNQSTKSNQSIKPPPSTTSPSIISRDKPPQLNQQQLNYTPSNPFIPNPLASPTLNPNQFNFLTAAVAATQGFHHGYDPRYHHHLPYHHQLYPPRLPPFAPPQVGNWWGSPPPASTLAVGQQVPLSGSSTNRNSSPRGLIWNGPSADTNVCSPKEAKTATSATIMDSKTNLDVLLPRSSSKKEAISISSINNKSTVKETNLIDSAHERKDDNKSKQTSATAKIAMSKEKPDVESKGEIVVVEKANDQATAVNKESKSTSETQSEKSEKLTQKNTSTDTSKENVVLAVT